MTDTKGTLTEVGSLWIPGTINFKPAQSFRSGEEGITEVTGKLSLVLRMAHITEDLVYQTNLRILYLEGGEDAKFAVSYEDVAKFGNPELCWWHLKMLLLQPGAGWNTDKIVGRSGRMAPWMQMPNRTALNIRVKHDWDTGHNLGCAPEDPSFRWLGGTFFIVI